MRKLILISMLVFIARTDASAQYWLGIINSNYAGVTNVASNPSSMAASRVKWDINVIGADLFLQNNYVYIPGIYTTKRDQETEFGGYAFMKDYYTQNPNKNFFGNVDLRLPAVMFRVQKHTFAISTGYRAMFSGEDIPFHVAKFAFNSETFGYTPQQNNLYTAKDFRIAAIAGFDLNLSYAYPIWNSQKNYLSAGITLKNTIANLGISLENHYLAYDVLSKSRMRVDSANIDFSHAMSDNNFFMAGTGIANGDIGFTYIRKQLPGEFIPYSRRKNVLKYKYKIGFSVVDMGRINFDGNARQTHIEGKTDWNGIDTVKFRNFDYFDNVLSNRFYGNPNGSFRSNSFYMGLPTVAILTFDINLNNNMNRWYLSGALIQSAPLISPSVVRPSVYSIGPRYESSRFEVSVPYSFYNYRDHRVGLAFRFNWFIIGTDKLGSYLGLNDFTGSDIYFAIKIPRFSENLINDTYLSCVYKKIVKKIKRRNNPKTPVVRF